MWVIENVAGTDAHEGGRIAVMTKVHHAGVDGVTGANLMSQLCSTEPDAAPPDPVEGVGDATGLEIAVQGAIKFATRPLKLVNVLPTTALSVIDTVKRARSGLSMAAPFAAPQTTFQANVTGHRNIAYAQLDLEYIKTVKQHFVVKVNDDVMALGSGGLRTGRPDGTVGVTWKRGEGDVPAGFDNSRLGVEHHRDVVHRQGRRRHRGVGRPAARSVGHGRRLRGRAERAGRLHEVTVGPGLARA